MKKPAIPNINNRYFFDTKEDDGVACYQLDYYREFMKENHVRELKLYLAKRETKSDYFYCKEFQECGEKGNCGTLCASYQPRNGKSGVCKHTGYTYEQTDTCVILKMVDGEFSIEINEV